MGQYEKLSVYHYVGYGNLRFSFQFVGDEIACPKRSDSLDL